MKKLVLVAFLAFGSLNAYAQTSTKTSTSSSISIHLDNDDYSYRASFEKRFTPKVKALLQSEFGSPEVVNGKLIWYWDDTVEIVLKKGKLTMEGEFASENTSKREFIKQIEKKIKARIN